MAVRTVGSLTPTTSTAAWSALTWNLYVTYDFTLNTFQWNVVAAGVGRTYTLTLDGVTIATGTAAASTTATLGAPVAVTPGVHVMKVAYSGVAFSAHPVTSNMAPIPGNEVFQVGVVVETAGNFTMPALYTIDSVQGTSVGELLSAPMVAGASMTEATMVGDALPLAPVASTSFTEETMVGLITVPEEFIFSNFTEEDPVRDAVYIAEAPPSGGGGEYLPTSGRIFPLT